MTKFAKLPLCVFFLLFSYQVFAAEENLLDSHLPDTIKEMENNLDRDQAEVGANTYQIARFLAVLTENSFQHSDLSLLNSPNVIFSREKTHLFSIYRNLHMLTKSIISDEMSAEYESKGGYLLLPQNAKLMSLKIHNAVTERIDSLLLYQKISAEDLKQLLKLLNYYREDTVFPCDL